MPSIAGILGPIILIAFAASSSSAQNFSPTRPPNIYRNTPQSSSQPGWAEAADTRQPVAYPPQGDPLPGGVIPAGFDSTLPPDDAPATFEDPGAAALGGLAERPLPRRRGESPRRLPPPGYANEDHRSEQAKGLPSMVTLVGSLATVLGIFFLVAWGMRRVGPPSLTPLPGDVFEVLGRAPLVGRQQVHLLRCGKKLLLISATADGVETLTEVTDPLEVDRLSGLCRQAHPNSATATFREVLGQISRVRSAGDLPSGSGVDRRRAPRPGSAASQLGLEDRNV